MTKMQALKEYVYAGRTYQAGEEFECADGEVVIIEAIQAAKRAAQSKPDPLPSPPQREPVLPYPGAQPEEEPEVTTRDMQAEPEQQEQQPKQAKDKQRYPRRDLRAKE